MASSRRTYDTDTITLRQVFAKNGNNTNIPALRVLTADGAGGTYWAVPSTLGVNPAFNQIITSAGTFTADLSYNTFRLLAGENMGMYGGPLGSNQTTLFAKAYSQIDVSGENTLVAFANGNLDSSLKIAGEGGIQLRADPATNTLFIDGPAPPIFIVSTGIYGFNQIKITEATSTITSSVQGFDGTFITADGPSTLLRFLGYNDIQLSTNTTTNSVYFTISTFTSKDYLNISNAAVSAYPSSMSTVSSLYVRLDQFYSSFGYFSSQTGFTFSSVVSSINALAMSTGSNYYILSGLINERLTIAQFLQYQADDRKTLNSTMASTVAGLGTAGYLSTVQLLSSSQEFLTSTVVGLGTLGYVSSASLKDAITSTVVGLGTLGYVSSTTLSDNNLFSTVAGLGSAGYVSSLSTIITSSIFNTGAISTFDLEVYGSNTFSVRGNAFMRGPTFISTLFVSSLNGSNSAFIGTSIPNVVSTPYLTTTLTSTVRGLGSASYTSTSYVGNAISTFSTAIGGVPPGFPSTVSTSYGTTFTTSNLLLSTMNKVAIAPSSSNLWVAVGYKSFGPSSNVVYSYDGRNWSDATSIDFGAQGVAYNGQMWVAVGFDTQSSTIRYSYNGINWFNSRGIGFDNGGFGVAWNGNQWLALGGYSANATSSIQYSFDGINWIGSAGPGFSQYGVSAAWNGSMWVASGWDSTSAGSLKFSYNGINWSNSLSGGFTYGPAPIGYGVAWNGSMWVAVGNDNTQNNTIKYSYDGMNWNNSVGSGFSDSGRAVAWNGRLWVAVGIDTTSNNTIKYSFDGISWSNTFGSGFTRSLTFAGGTGIAWNGSYWIATGFDDTPLNRIKISADGITWSNSLTQSLTEANGVAFSSNSVPSYSQKNLIIYPQGEIPLFLYSTNNIYAAPSTLIINNTLNVHSQLKLVGINCNSPQYSLDVNGTANISTLFVNKSSFTSILTSTVAGIGGGGSGGLSQANLTSTVVGLGTVGYLSSVGGVLSQANLTSTVVGLGSVSYVSTPQLISTVGGTTNTLNTTITSTTIGLGSLGYISSAGLTQGNLTSTVQGLGTAGYVSTTQLLSTIASIGGGSLTQTYLTSSIRGLGSAGYISSAGGGLSVANLTSTVQGLGTAGYISTASGGAAGFPSTVSTSYSISFNTSSFTASTVNFINIRPSSSNVWVAVGLESTPSNIIKYSYDGSNWTGVSGDLFTTAAWAVAWNGSMWVAVGNDSVANGRIKYSFNGINWTNSSGASFSGNGAGGVAWNGRIWVAVGIDSAAVSLGSIKYSGDGINWSNSISGAFESQGRGVAWNGIYWVAVGYDSQPNNVIKYSFNGMTWSNSTSGAFDFGGRRVAWGGRMWVAAGEDTTPNNRLKYSFDGLNWSNSQGATFTEAYGVAWNGQIWVAGGATGVIATSLKYSLDGINWSNAASGGFNGGNGGQGFTWNGQIWVAVGNGNANGATKYSFDGINWIDSVNGSFTGGWGTSVAFSSNVTPSYNQNNLNILSQNIPTFLTSTNTFLPQISSLIINNTLEIDRQWNRVGINCNIPNYSLDIAGSLNTSSFFINTSSFTNILTSTVAGIGSGSGLTQANLTSSIVGLGTAGYISTAAGGAAAFPSTLSTSFGRSFTTSLLITSTMNKVALQPPPNTLIAGTTNPGGGQTYIRVSLDGGSNWRNIASGDFTAAAVGFGYNGNYWVACGQGGTGLKYSLDGLNWSDAVSGAFTSGGFSVAWNGKMWVAGGQGDATIRYSFDGLNWSNTTGGFTTAGFNFAWNGNMWVGVGSDSGNNSVKYSYDGINWSNRLSGDIISFQGGLSGNSLITWGKDRWVLTGQVQSTLYTSNSAIQYSFDGLNWSNSLGPSFNFNLSGFFRGTMVLYNGNIFIASGVDSNNGRRYSFDGIRWFNGTGNVGNSMNNTVWTGQYFWGILAVGPLQVVRSFDGINWENFNTPFGGSGSGLGYSSNTALPYDQGNLQITGCNQYIIQGSYTSTNLIMTQISSLVINETMKIDRGTGRVGINSNYPRYTLDVLGNGSFSTLTITGGATVTSTNTDFALTVFGTQGVARIGGTTWTQLSDQRVKENIISADLDRCYNDIKNIPLRRFTYTSSFFQDFNLKDKNVLGFIAQEISTVQPKAITVSPGFGLSDTMWVNLDQLNMSLYGSVKKLIQDKESADSTIRGQAFQLETLNGRFNSMFSTLEGLQGR